MARNLNVAGRTTFTGYLSRSEVDGLLHASGCAVFTSTLESFGSGPVEAMACGCPVVACHTAAIPEIIGDAGVLVPPGDVEGFKGAVLRLVDDEERRAHLVERGLRRARAFDWRSSAAKLCRLLEQLGAGDVNPTVGTSGNEQ